MNEEKIKNLSKERFSKGLKEASDIYLPAIEEILREVYRKGFADGINFAKELMDD